MVTRRSPDTFALVSTSSAGPRRTWPRTPAARQHVVEHGRALLAGARLRGLPGAPTGRARRIPSAGRRGGDQRHPRAGRGGAVVLVGPHGVRGGAGGRPPQRRGTGGPA